MVRSCIIIAAVGLAFAPFAQAAAQQSSSALPPDVRANIEKASDKACNDDLDHNRFGSYSSIEECVADKTAKMEHEYRASHRVAESGSR